MSEQNESKLGKILGGVIFFAVAAVLGWLACGMYTGYMKKTMAAKMQEQAAARASAVTVAVTNAVMMDYNLPEKFVAWVEPMQEVMLVPEVEGYIKEILFNEGDVVKKGQLLYTLDLERYQAVVNQREADLVAAQTEYRRAKRQNDRFKNADDRGITQVERDNAEAAEDKANAAVEQAKANLVVAKYYLNHATVKAPFDGRIGKSSVHIGDFVAPSKNSLAKIVQFDPIRVRFPITDRFGLKLIEDQKKNMLADYRMKLTLANDKPYAHVGTWDFVDNQISEATATLIMRVRFPNPDGLLFPNEYVNLWMDYAVPPKYLCVPQQCVIDLAGGNRAVWIVKDDMTVEQRIVETKEMYRGWIPVVSGVKEGEKVVLAGMGKLGPGMKVTFVEPTSNYDINPGHVPPINE